MRQDGPLRQPIANTSMWQAYREVLPVLRRQLAYEDFFLRRDLPPTARPYREDLHTTPAPAA